MLAVCHSHITIFHPVEKWKGLSWNNKANNTNETKLWHQKHLAFSLYHSMQASFFGQFSWFELYFNSCVRLLKRLWSISVNYTQGIIPKWFIPTLKLKHLLNLHLFCFVISLTSARLLFYSGCLTAKVQSGQTMHERNVLSFDVHLNIWCWCLKHPLMFTMSFKQIFVFKGFI